MECTDDGIYEIDNIKVGDRYRYKIKPKAKFAEELNKLRIPSDPRRQIPVEELDKIKEEYDGRFGNS